MYYCMPIYFLVDKNKDVFNLCYSKLCGNCREVVHGGVRITVEAVEHGTVILKNRGLHAPKAP